MKTKSLFFLFLLATGCSTLPGKQTDVKDHKSLEYVLLKNNGPTVVFENGLGGHMEWWKQVLPEVAKEATCFAYNRPGVGGSSAATTPRTGDVIIEELRATLKAKNLQPPYILVGHSSGGLYMQLFARSHPEEVSSLILVDSTHPNQLKGDGARDKWPLFTKFVFWLLMSNHAEAELAKINETGELVLSRPTYTKGPVIILSAKKPMDENGTALARDSNQKRADLAQLYPGAEQQWIDSGHAMPLEKPEAIVAAVKKALGK